MVASKVRIRIGGVEIENCTDLSIKAVRVSPACTVGGGKPVFETIITFQAVDLPRCSLCTKKKQLFEFAVFTKGDVTISTLKKCEVKIHKAFNGTSIYDIEARTVKKPKSSYFENVWWA